MPGGAQETLAQEGGWRLRAYLTGFSSEEDALRYEAAAQRTHPELERHTAYGDLPDEAKAATRFLWPLRSRASPLDVTITPEENSQWWTSQSLDSKQLRSVTVHDYC
jgi:hypothetical protein